MGPLEHAALVGAILDSFDVDWVLGGSAASSLLGEPRSTNDIDVALSLSEDRVPVIAEALSAEYLAPTAPLVAAAANHDSFNLLHTATGFKVDLFFLGDNPLDRWQLARRVWVEAPTGERLWVTSAADLVLRKLWWFRLGGEVSDRQWRDILSILRVQRAQIDAESLRADATEVDLDGPLDRALVELAG